MKLNAAWIYKTLWIFLALVGVFLLLLSWPSGAGNQKPTPFLQSQLTKIEKLTQHVPKMAYRDTEIDDRVIDNIISFRDTVFNSKVTALYKSNKRSTQKVYVTPINVFEGTKTFSKDSFKSTPSKLFIDTAYFNSNVNFTLCPLIVKSKDLSDPFTISNTKIDGKFEFYIDKLTSNMKFDQDDFEGKIILTSKDTLKGDILFQDCNFHNGFGGNPDNNNNEEIYAPSARLKTYRDLTFNGCGFNGTFNLSGNLFLANSRILLEGCILPDTINLAGIKVDLFDVTGVKDTSNKITYLNLVGSDINKLNLDYSHFHLYFPANTTQDQITRVYQKLLKFFKDEGYDSSYEKLDIEFKYQNATADNYDDKAALFRYLDKYVSSNFSSNLRSLVNNLRLSVLIYWINRAWWNYGYDRGRIIHWCLVLILLFSWYNSYRYEKLLTVFCVEKLDPSTIPDDISRFKRKVIRYWYCLVYTGLVFFKINFDFKNMNFASRYMVIILGQDLVGLICTAFIVNLILGK